MILFELQDNKVTFSPQALMLKPFKALWDRDKTKDKTRARNELAFVYYFSDYKSDFSSILDDDERATEILKFLSDIDKPDNKVYEACEFYKSRRETISTQLLEAARHGAKTLKEYYYNVDLTLTDEKGKPVWDVAKLQTSLKTLSDTIEGLEKLEDKVKREQEKESSMRGGREKAMFEDGQLVED